MKARAYENNTLPIVAIVDMVKKFKFDVQQLSTDVMKEEIGEVLNVNFNAGLYEEMNIILNQFLGSIEARRQDCYVVFDSNSLLRLDVYYYKYDFKSKALKKHGKNMFCYVVQVGVLNSAKIDPHKTLYELTKYAGSENVKESKQQLEQQACFAELFSFFLDINKLRIFFKELIDNLDKQISRCRVYCVDLDVTSGCVYYYKTTVEGEEL
ncbi:hypothetical protein QZH41_000561 [Actinostola sp. cb2023]|nr:hypothetical protein QZH41_000561 [Actinostola sp. cb2023]